MISEIPKKDQSALNNVIAFPSKANKEFDQRLLRINNALNRINRLMKELKAKCAEPQV